MKFYTSDGFLKHWRMLAAVVGMIVLIVLGGALYYRSESASHFGLKQREIQTIAELKVAQISEWHKERIADARVISESPLFRQAMKEWVVTPPNRPTTEALRKQLLLPKLEYGYEDICIAAPDGKLLLTFDSSLHELDPATRALVQGSATSRDVIVTGPYYCPTHRKIHFDILAPVRDEKDRMMAVLMFRIDPSVYLYPLIRSWPVPSTTTEALLLRKDGDSALFLNDLRHQTNSALQMRRSLSDTTNPGVQAVLGYTGIFEGLDYRGVRVLAYIAPVPNTQWVLVAKMDEDELSAELNTNRTLLVIVTVVSILLLLAVFAVYYRSLQKSAYQSLFVKEKELRLHHEEFKTILYSIGDGVITTDSDGRVKQMNSTAVQLTGWQEADAQGIHLDDVFSIINETTRQPVDSPLRQVLKEGIVVGLANHTLLVAKDGTEKPIADSGAPIRDGGGNISGTVLVFRDKTHEHEAQRQLHESELRLRRAVLNAPFPIMIHAEDGEVVMISNTWTELTGYTHAEIPTTTVWAEKAYGTKKHLVRNDIDRLYRLTEKIHEGDYEVTTKAGEKRIWDFMSSPLGVLPDGRRMAISMAVDMTDRKLAEEALRENEQNYRTLADSGLALIWVAGTDKLCYYFNRVWLEFTGRTLEQEMGNGWTGGVHPDDFQRCLNIYVGAFDKRERFNMEYRLRRHDGEYRWIYDYGTPRYSSTGEFIGYIGHCLDISERREAEESMRRIEERLSQSQKMDAIGQLAGGIAHDFNNVLGGIIGYTDMSLAYAEKGSKLETNLNKVLKASDRAKNLVQQILSYSRHSSAQRSIIEIRPIITEVLDLLRASIPSSVFIETDLQTNTKPVLAESTKLHEAILNLATNALHAMNRKGTLTVRLYGERLDNPEYGRCGEIMPGEYTVIEIADTGCGMDQATLAKAFDPFFTTKGVGEGTGMGLSVVLGVVQSHDGNILVRSEPGVGTTVRVFLPVRDEAVSDAATVSMMPAVSGAERILFVDDEEMMTEMVSAWLHNLGYTTTAMTDSLAALDFIKENEIDLLITDQTMPGMTGFELAKAALEIDPGLPIILCTGFSAEVTAATAAEVGINNFIMKPYRRHEIATSIREILDNTASARRKAWRK